MPRRSAMTEAQASGNQEAINRAKERRKAAEKVLQEQRGRVARVVSKLERTNRWEAIRRLHESEHAHLARGAGGGRGLERCLWRSDGKGSFPALVLGG